MSKPVYQFRKTSTLKEVQEHQYRYSITGTPVQVQQYRNTSTGTAVQEHQYRYSSTGTLVQVQQYRNMSTEKKHRNASIGN